MDTPKILRWFGLIAAGCGLLAVAGQVCARGQTLNYESGESSAHGNKKLKKEAAASGEDAAYTAKIREFTTEPYLSTELVDHLPASATVPTPTSSWPPPKPTCTPSTG